MGANMAVDVTNDEDITLVHATLQGNSQAFNQLILKYQNPIFNTILRMIGDYETSLDLTQETFLKAYQGLDKFREQSSFFTWLFQIALNIANSQRRYYARHPRNLFLSQSNNNDDSSQDTNIPSHEQLPEAQLIQNEMQSLVQKAISSLPSEFREVIILRDIQGLSYEDIRDILRCPIGTVRSRLHRGREMLKEKLSNAI